MELANARLCAQGLIDSDLPDPVAVVDRLLAVQSQDPRGMRLAIRPRLAREVEHPGASMLEALINDSSLVVGSLNRGTLHLVRHEDYRWLHAVTSPRQAAANRTRLKQEGVSPGQADKGVDLIVRQLGSGPASRGEIRETLESADVPVAGQALAHILFLASIRGLILRGPILGKEQSFVLVEDWLGPDSTPDVDVALTELARRYLAGHGPATDRDLAKWAGIPLGQARRGLESIGGELVQMEGDLTDLKARAIPGEHELPVRLLGSFDPLLHGWETRELILPDEKEREVVTTNGIFRPSILDRDRIGGTWSMRNGKIELKPFAGLSARTVKALATEEERVRDYLAG